jgi:hypothetical protein
MKIVIKLPKSNTTNKLPVTKANQPHKSKKDYRRKEKHEKRLF